MALSLRRIYRIDFIIVFLPFTISNGVFRIVRAIFGCKTEKNECKLEKTSITFGQLTRLSCIWLMYSLFVKCVRLNGWLALSTSATIKTVQQQQQQQYEIISPRFKRYTMARCYYILHWLFVRALAFKCEWCVNLQKKRAHRYTHKHTVANVHR